MLFLAEAQHCIITTYHSYLVLARQILGWKKGHQFHVYQIQDKYARAQTSLSIIIHNGTELFPKE